MSYKAGRFFPSVQRCKLQLIDFVKAGSFNIILTIHGSRYSVFGIRPVLKIVPSTEYRAPNTEHRKIPYLHPQIRIYGDLAVTGL